MCLKLKLLSLAMVSVGSVASAQEPVGGKTQAPAPIVVGNPPAANASKADYSYFLGFDFGSGLASRKMTEQDIDTKELLAGLVDALASKKPRLSEKDMDSVVATLNNLIQKKLMEVAKSNLDKANKYLEANKAKEGVQTLKSGLQYQVVATGSGKQPTVADTVMVHYEGKLTDGTVFDSSIARGEPAKFPVGRVVPGFAEALQRMKVGDKWLVTIPPGLGYGEQGGPGGSIGPNEVLIFQLELLDVLK
jgi:FKBP-type peptidyl-prolyl cis-trans isomerase FklB